MTIYNVQIGNRNFLIDITDNQLFIDGIKQQVRLIQLNANDLFLLCWERTSRVLHLQPQDGQTFAVTTEGRRVIAQVESGHTASGKPRAASLPAANQLLAPMPGLVTAVKVEVGDPVEKGQVLVTEESMKMQMELRAPLSGKVIRVSATPGAQVEKGTLLVEIQPAEN